MSRWTTDYCADGHDECRDYLIFHNTVPNASGVVFRREIYDRVGGADESLRLCGDWKLWAAMAFTGRVAYLGEPLNYFRFHDATVRNKSRYEGRDVAERLRVIRWILERVTPAEAVARKTMRNVLVLLGSRYNEHACSTRAEAVDPQRCESD